jgi:hypothetical protein
MTFGRLRVGTYGFGPGRGHSEHKDAGTVGRLDLRAVD